ncbi:MAG: BRO family protein, partial [Acidithiobacillus sp.]
MGGIRQTRVWDVSVVREQEITVINEPNLYRLIIKSRKPEAEK